MNRLNLTHLAQASRIPGNGDSLKQNYDKRKDEMRIKTIMESSQKLKKHMMAEIEKMVPSRQKSLSRLFFPRWLNNAVVIILRCLPPAPLIQWAMRGAQGAPHIAYRWALLLPLVVPSSLIRVLLVSPLQFMQAKVFLFGIKREIKNVSEFEVELVLTKRGQPPMKWRQDWRYGEMRKVIEK